MRRVLGQRLKCPRIQHKAIGFILQLRIDRQRRKRRLNVAALFLSLSLLRFQIFGTFDFGDSGLRSHRHFDIFGLPRRRDFVDLSLFFDFLFVGFPVLGPTWQLLSNIGLLSGLLGIILLLFVPNRCIFIKDLPLRLELVEFLGVQNGQLLGELRFMRQSGDGFGVLLQLGQLELELPQLRLELAD